MTLSNSSSVLSKILAWSVNAALLTRMSMPPNLATTFLIISCTSFDFETSPSTSIASWPNLLISSTTDCPRPSCISATAILAPSDAKSFAIALPMFRPAPVMIATCPFNFISLVPFQNSVSPLSQPPAPKLRHNSHYFTYRCHAEQQRSISHFRSLHLRKRDPSAEFILSVAEGHQDDLWLNLQIFRRRKSVDV